MASGVVAWGSGTKGAEKVIGTEESDDLEGGEAVIGAYGRLRARRRGKQKGCAAAFGRVI